MDFVPNIVVQAANTREVYGGFKTIADERIGKFSKKASDI